MFPPINQSINQNWSFSPDTEHLSEFTTTDCETDGGFLTEFEGDGGGSSGDNKVQLSRLKPHVKGFLAIDAKYLFPFFTVGYFFKFHYLSFTRGDYTYGTI